MSKQKTVTVNPDETRNEQEETTMNNYYDENETQANDIQDEASANEPETTPEEQQVTETPKKKFGWKEFIIGGLVGVPTGIALTCTWFALKGKKGVPAPKLDNVVDIATKLVEEKAKEA